MKLEEAILITESNEGDKVSIEVAKVLLAEIQRFRKYHPEPSEMTGYECRTCETCGGLGYYYRGK